MDEFVDVFDEDGNYLKSCSRKDVHKNGLWHKASGVIILNSKKQILLQQRSKLKEKNAGLWDMSASGHIPSGQTPDTSLIREIEEELGLVTDISQLKLLGIYKRHEKHATGGGYLIENEFDYIYILESDVDVSKLKLQVEEVDDVKFVSVKDFLNLLKNGEVVKRVRVWDDMINYINKK